LSHVKLIKTLPGPLAITQYIPIGELSSSYCSERLLLKNRSARTHNKHYYHFDMICNALRVFQGRMGKTFKKSGRVSPPAALEKS
jgi:predicted nucleotide-binding protein (sugar kinase/HSP70/actin superfamily)